MNYIAECLARFQALPDNAREIFGGAEIYIAIKEIEDAYKVQLSFLLILVVLGELEEDDIEEYLIAKFKVKVEAAKKIKTEFSKILDDAFKRAGKLETAGNSLEKRTNTDKDDLMNLFSKRIIESIKADADTIFSLNIFIFKTLDKGGDLGEKIINILYNNGELVTSKRLVSDEKEVSPTVANWIKDFIRVNGSGMFDEVVLAQYLSTSTNTKNLSPEEKDLLRKLFKLYRNLVFYPESMDNLAVEDYQIIPYDRTEIKSHEFRDVLDDSYTKDMDKPVLKISPKVEAKKEVSQLDELQEALPNYIPGSLEHKAVTQEIIRLKNKK